jgi:TolA-binding protein
MSVENAKKKDQLQQQMKKLQREIAEMEKAIQTTSTQKKLTLQQVEEVKKKIKQKEGQIAGFKKEVGALSKDIKKTEVEIDEKAARIDLMKNKYGYVLGQIYSSLIQNTGNVSFLWNNNKSFITSNYLKTISDYRRSQAAICAIIFWCWKTKNLTSKPQKKKPKRS